jgi:superfamily II DNA/RNA helicase
MSFKDLGLSPELLKALKPKTYPSPTEVQRELIPAVLKGQDAWVTAPTGSGKTLAYALPLIEQLKYPDFRRRAISERPKPPKLWSWYPPVNWQFRSANCS